MRKRNALVAWVTVATFFVAAAPCASAALSRSEQSLLAAVNQTRAARSLPRVVLVPALERSARAHSLDMLKRQYFAHRDFPSRLWEQGADGPIVGEDLGWSVDDGNSTQRIVSMWLANPTHRAILLRPGFRHVGIGVSRGPFKGWTHAVVVTADFEGK